MGTRSPAGPEAEGPGKVPERTLAPSAWGWSRWEGSSSYMEGRVVCIPSHKTTTQDTIGDSGGIGLCETGLQQSPFFLLFFRKEGVRNFFFFLDGDLPGDPSLPGSSAAGEAASSATWAGAGSGLATGGDLVGSGGPRASQRPSSSFSDVGKPSASEGSSGDRSGRVGLKVAASLSSPEMGSGGRSGGRAGERALKAPAQAPKRGLLGGQALHRNCHCTDCRVLPKRE